MGIGKTPIFSYGKLNCRIRLCHRLKLIPVVVVPDDVIPVPILIGRDALLLFHIDLYFRISQLNLITENVEPFRPLEEPSDNKNNLSFDILLNKSNENEIEVFLMDNLSTALFPSSSKISAISNIDEKKTNDGDDSIDHGFRDLGNVHLTYTSETSDLSSGPSLCIPFTNTIALVDSSNVDIASEWDINPNLDVRSIECVHECLSRNYDNVDLSQIQAPEYEMSIQLTHSTPIYARPRRLAHTELLKVREMVQTLMDDGTIRNSHSPYASPIVLVQKKNGDTRMCIDYRALNRITVRDHYPLPLIDDCLDYLTNKKIFSLIDLKSGFNQVKMADESIKYTSFVTPEGQYEYVKMPFGLTNAPSVFQRFINLILRPFIQTGQIVVYMDDILIASETLDDHLLLIEKVLSCIVKNGLQIQKKKCQFAYNELEYLGFRVSSQGIQPGSLKTKAISEFPRPSDVKSVQSFLGLCSFFRRFIPGFSQIAHPLYKLLHKDAVFNFNDNCYEAFQKLKSSLTSEPVLCVYDPLRETELHTDASKIGFGAVLMQKQNDGKFHPVAYYSKAPS